MSRGHGRRSAERVGVLHYLVMLLLLLSRTAAADAPLPASPPAHFPEEPAADSPQAAVARYLELCADGRYVEAARFLVLPRPVPDGGAALARRLRDVLDRHVALELAMISPLPEGDTHDDLPAGIDEIARVPGPSGRLEPVRLIRRVAGAEPAWAFTRGTVERIGPWYQGLETRWFLEHLPDAMLRDGPAGLRRWQWLALPLMGLLSWLIGLVLGRLTGRALGCAASRTRTRWDDVILARVSDLLTAAWSIALLYALLPWLGLPAPAESVTRRGMRIGLFIVVFWVLLRAVGILGRMTELSPWAKEHPGARSLVPLGARAAKVALVALACIAILSELGFPVASLIAGLGIGGLALALAAQKTVENLFGAFSIGVDQPFEEGDFVRVAGFLGTIESIGLRSTRLRTLDRTLVSIPNGRLADMDVECLSARDRMRLACTLGLVYGTTAPQLREVLARLERALREHPKIWTETVVVRFKELGAYSLDIEVMAWFGTSDWGEFQLIRQELLLQFMEIVESAGSSFAFPTRTIHLVAPST